MSTYSYTPIRALSPKNRNLYIGYIYLAIGSRSNREYYKNTLNSNRYQRYVSSYRYIPIPIYIYRIYYQFLEARRSSNTSKGVSFLTILYRIELIYQYLITLRLATKVTLEYISKYSSDSSNSRSKKKKKKKRAY